VKALKASIDVYLVVNGTRTLKRGSFNVLRVEDIPKVAHDWIRQIRRETGYYGDESLIEKVILDGDQDITDKVREIDKAPLK
jgi:D-mannonate dehydratase